MQSSKTLEKVSPLSHVKTARILYKKQVSDQSISLFEYISYSSHTLFLHIQNLEWKLRFYSLTQINSTTSADWLGRGRTIFAQHWLTFEKNKRENFFLPQLSLGWIACQRKVKMALPWPFGFHTPSHLVCVTSGGRISLFNSIYTITLIPLARPDCRACLITLEKLAS